jgi:hypothetical protein
MMLTGQRETRGGPVTEGGVEHVFSLLSSPSAFSLLKRLDGLRGRRLIVSFVVLLSSILCVG